MNYVLWGVRVLHDRMTLLVRLRDVCIVSIATFVLLILYGCAGDDRRDPVGVTPNDDGTIEVILNNYAYEPERLLFELGESVEFRLTSEDEVHTFTVEELGINWVVPGKAKSQLQVFTFEKAGSFELICTIPGHEGLGMVGIIDVR